MAINFNPVASFLQGQQAGQSLQDQQRQQQINALQQGIAQQAGQGGFNPSQSLDFQELTALDPQRAGQVASTFRGLSKDRQKAYFDDVVSARNMVADNNMQGAIDLFTDRRSAIVNLNGDTSGTDAVLAKMSSGDSAGVLRGLDSAKEAGVQLGFLKEAKDPDAPDSSTANAKDWNKFQDLLTSDPKKAEQFGRKVGFIRPTEQQKSDIKITESEKKTMAKANIKRKQGFIDSGIEAANGAANLNRALTLLDGVSTGGFDNLALKVKQAFGVEGADEGELSSLMGKAVLAQLKPIFGAAFTASEGESLARLEAQFGRNPKTNRKLIENALKIVNRSARRGIAAAEDQGDNFTADEIRNSLALRLEGKSDVVGATTQAVGSPPTTIGRFTVEVQ